MGKHTPTGERQPAQPPRDDLVRAIFPGCEFRAEQSDGSLGLMVGHFAVFNQWTEIVSSIEGHFFERFASSAFSKTIKESRDRIRVLFYHGRDPQIGNKVLGPINVLEEQAEGVWYEVPLLDTSYNRDLEPGLRAHLYGSSFRFRTVKEDLVMHPRASERNPDGIPERTILEAKLYEFGPCTWGQYENATAGMRSLTDEYMEERHGILVPSVTFEDRRALLERLNEEDEEISEHVAAAFRGREGVVRLASPDSRLYERAVEFVSTACWAVHPDTLALIKAIIAERASGNKPSDEEVAQRIASHIPERELSDSAPDESVAVIDIYGVIVPKGPLLQETSDGQLAGVEGIQKELRAAVADDRVKAILLNIDSPGGDVSLVPELAAEILDARKAKPVVAIANTWAASAAYWLLSAASTALVTPSGKVGSIGVWTAHEDLSGMMEQQGVDVTLISAGEYKVEGNPYEPLSDAAREKLQADVNAYYEMFVSGVAKGRGVKGSTVKAEFGKGRMIMAADAAELGMVDAVMTYDEALAKLTKNPETFNRSEPEPPAATTPEDEALTETRAEETHSGAESRSGDAAVLSHEPTTEEPIMGDEDKRTCDEKRARQKEIKERLKQMDAEIGERAFSPEEAKEWRDLEREHETLQKDIEDTERRRDSLARLSETEERIERPSVNVRVTNDPFDMTQYRASDPEKIISLRCEGAKRVVDSMRSLPHPAAKLEASQERIVRLLETDKHGELAERILRTMSPDYKRAFGKAIVGRPVTSEERLALERTALAIGGTANYAVPIDLDPTVINTSNGSVNPLRQIAKVVNTVGNHWKGVTSSGGAGASYDAEATEVSDDTPALGQPEIYVEKAQTSFEWSVESEDWQGIQQELAVLLSDEKDDLEAVKFVLGAGHGSKEPEGIVTGITNTYQIASDAINTLGRDDLDAIEEGLGAKYRARASWLGSRSVYNVIRQFDTSGGEALWLRIGEGLPNLQTGALGQALKGYLTYEASSMSGTIDGGEKVLILGDFRGFVIVDRVGLNVEPFQVLGNSHRPTGQRGLYAYWRNSSGVVNPNAFRMLVIQSS